MGFSTMLGLDMRTLARNTLRTGAYAGGRRSLLEPDWRANADARRKFRSGAIAGADPDVSRGRGGAFSS